MQWLVLTWGILSLCSVALSVTPKKTQSLQSLVFYFATWFFSEFALQWAVFHFGVNLIFFALGLIETQTAWAGVILSLSAYIATGLRLNRLTYLRFYAQQQLKSVLGYRYELDIHLEMRQRLFPLPVNWKLLWNPQKLLEQIQVKRDAEFCKNPSLSVDIYEPAIPIFEKAPVLIEVCEKTWHLGTQRQPFLCRMARQGWKCFSISSLMSGDSIVNCKRAIAYIRQNAEHYQIDPDFIVLSGASFGASVASLVALTPKENENCDDLKNCDFSVQGCVSWYGIYDVRNQHAMQRLLSRLCPDFSKTKQAFSLVKIGKGHPPFLVIQGSADILTSLESAKDFYNKLSSSYTAMIALPLAGHRFDATYNVTAQCAFPAVERYLAFLFSKHLISQTN